MAESFKEAEFVVLLTRAQFDLRVYIATLLGGLQDVDDVLQETNLDIWRKISTYDRARPFLPWAKALARFQVLRWRTDQLRDHLVFDEELLERFSVEDAEDEDYALVMRALDASIWRLSRADRRLLREKYENHLSVAQLATRFNQTESSVVSKLYRLRKFLRACIKRVLRREAR